MKKKKGKVNKHRITLLADRKNLELKVKKVEVKIEEEEKVKVKTQRITLLADRKNLD